MYLLYQLKNPVAGQIRVNYLVGAEVPSKKGGWLQGAPAPDQKVVKKVKSL